MVRMRAGRLVLGATAALGVILVLLVAVAGDEETIREEPAESVAARSALEEAPETPTTRPATTPPTPTVPATSAAPTTTTTLTVTTETTTAPSPSTTDPKVSDYTPVPKPGSGPGTVAPGGALTKHLAGDIATAFGFDTMDIEQAISELQLPPEAGGNPEGWLAPGTYPIGENATPQAVAQSMVDRRVAQLEERGIPREQWQRVLTAASVIEKETYNQNEKPGVARVLTNRLAGGGPLQMDSIILYPVPEDRIFTSSAERASDQPYNSYRHNGLPPTPICSPDEASLDAFLAPPPGDWWFYVTIDLDSGETRYAVTYDEHLENVELLRAWLGEHPTP